MSYGSLYPLSAAPHNLQIEWAEDSDNVILRRFSVCERYSISRHGRSRMQAHDQRHDWIENRRVRCPSCRKTCAFLRPFSFRYPAVTIAPKQIMMRDKLIAHF
jgi:hypothetical protein